MSRWLPVLTATLAVALGVVSGIGENPMDFQNIASMITGLGHMIQNPIDTVDVPSQMLMGKWHQVYKAAVNFDVYRSQMYCQVCYCKWNFTPAIYTLETVRIHFSQAQPSDG